MAWTRAISGLTGKAGTGLAEMGDIGLHHYTWRYGQVTPPTATSTATPVATHTPGEGPLAAQGVLTFLRVHDVGTGYGPPGNVIDGEVVIKLDSEGNRAFGFQLRVDNSNRAARQGMLDLLRDAYNNNWQVIVDYNIDDGKTNGVIIRTWLTK